MNGKPSPASVTHKSRAHMMLSHPANLLSHGFGSGLSPIVPGTVGTLFGWLVFVALSANWPWIFTPGTWGIIIAIGFLVGVWACHHTGRALGVPDHGSIVWDEIIAIWLVLIFLMPASLSTQVWAFFWFRFFDMLKPPPIGYIDRRFKGGFWVMVDDIIAAFFTLILFAVWRTL